jgi:nanoRNase/pAp phosphatase (c-di-AMP/oligoRNAs hydrolase)
MGYNVVAVNDDKNPKDFSFLEVDHIINPELNISEFKPDLIISLDAASLSQLGETYINNEEIFKNTDFVVFDHHITNSGF